MVAVRSASQPESIHDLATPAVLVDVVALDANLEAMRLIAERAGVALRPHVKTHKSTLIAGRQRSAGASGITVATMREAEAMTAAGFTDLLLAYPPIGGWRLERLAALLERAEVMLVLDSIEAAREASALASRLDRTLRCRWEIDCGARRCGTEPGEVTGRCGLGCVRAPGS